ncbi:MAG: tripartite tricarboxylate transporter substrate-binding protein [Hyphomicrobium sp.]
MNRRLLIGFSMAVAVAGVTSAAHAQADFYKGKTVSVVVGAKGGSLTIAAQLVGQHLGKHIPGNPSVVVVQMPGGAHLVATGHVFNVPEPDGLTILAANSNVALAQVAKLPQVRFDLRRFEWLGSSGSDGSMLSVGTHVPFKTFAELKASGKELIVGTTGPGSNAHDMPLLLKEFAGAKFKLISGYAANSDILLAVERKEVDVWAALATTIKAGVDRGAVRPLVRARAPVPGFNDLPIDESLTDDPVGKSLMAIRGIPLQIGRSFAVRAGVPADRLKALRAALEKTVTDPAFLADATKAKIDMVYIAPDVVAKGFAEVLSQPPAVIEAMGKYMKPGE